MLLNYSTPGCHCSFRTERKSSISLLLLFFSLEWFSIFCRLYFRL